MTCKKATLADFIGDTLTYRNMEPMQPNMQSLHTAWREIGLDHYYVPRKTQPEYATVLVYYLRQAQALRGVSKPLERLLFIGDTFVLDGSAARNVGKHLPLLGFIGAERAQQPAQVEIQGDLMVANRWAALEDFLQWVRRSGVPFDERTALLVDLDKTFIGARGRNDKPIDEARVQAVYNTMYAALGDNLDRKAFRSFYDALNPPQYHAFTADNQDYLAYVCLMVMGSVCPAEELWQDLQGGTLTSFTQFVERCDARQARMSDALREAHAEVRRGLEAEDPTPFKAFRRREYLETIARMDALPDDTAETDLLTREILITAEVADTVEYLRGQGVLVFGISDKPDEASIPTPEQASQGRRPLHRTTMKLYGQRVCGSL